MRLLTPGLLENDAILLSHSDRRGMGGDWTDKVKQALDCVLFWNPVGVSFLSTLSF